MIILKVKLKFNVNGAEITDHEKVDTTTTWKILDMQPEEICEGKFIHVNEESGCDAKGYNLSEEASPVKYFI